MEPMSVSRGTLIARPEQTILIADELVIRRTKRRLLTVQLRLHCPAHGEGGIGMTFHHKTPLGAPVTGPVVLHQAEMKALGKACRALIPVVCYLEPEAKPIPFFPLPNSPAESLNWLEPLGTPIVGQAFEPDARQPGKADLPPIGGQQP